jgi:gas vesicle protein
MRFLAILLLVGIATASVYEEFEDAAEDIYQEFMFGLEEAGSFKDAVGYDHPILLQAEDDTKTELGKRLRETLDEILEKMRDSLEKGKAVGEDMQKKLKEVREKLKELKQDIGGRARELMNKIKEKAKKLWEDFINKLKGDEKRSIDEPMSAFELKDIFKKIKKLLREKIDKEQLKAKIENFFGKGSEMADSLLKLINEKGDKYKQKLLDLIDRYVGNDQDPSYSVSEYWEKVKEYFKNLHIDLKEKYMKFGEWVKKHFEKGLEKGKDKMANIKKIAREFIDNTKGVSKDVAVEALEFLKPYKEDLGSLWDQVKETVKDIINKRD